MKEPAWLTEARRHIGTREIKGAKHESKILVWWKAIRRGGIKDDETPWCAAFVGGCLEAVGQASSRYESAKSYLTWGDSLAFPCVGAIVVFSREGGGGHVGFVVGKDKFNNLMVLGGNQGDAVNIKPFAMSRVTGLRVPKGYMVPSEHYTLPVLASDGKLSTNEA